MISTKGRYALRVMIDLAEHQDEGFIPLNLIAERQSISEKYLESILKILVKEKLLKGHRGKGGGYKLTKEPQEYTVYEILDLTEGSLATVACLSKDAEPCPQKENCRTIPMWERFDTMIKDFFEGVTIADLVRESNGLV